MIKFVYCVRRNPTISPQEFKKYWIEDHGPLVRKYAQTLRAKKYVQSHTLNTPINDIAQQTRGAKAPYDGITEVWWDSLADLQAAISTPEGMEANRILVEDEARFCDLANCSVFLTEEVQIFG